MRFTIEYIPLRNLDANANVRFTDRIKQLRRVVWDSSHLLAVRRNGKGGRYTIVGGHDRYRYLKAHTNKAYAPCVLDDASEKRTGAIPSWIRKFRNRRLPKAFPNIHPENVSPAAWSIIRAFAKEEPRFAKLTRVQQIKVLLVAVRYKKTVVRAMRSLVDELSSKTPS
ncbi:hypothetical protein [Paenibacillus sp.]|uniref:hypothetical protein n=1 Tax=Paenibacillus sp. TaxID=58172 RepID=UPI002D405F37|nr:hypothetical protein [Paenibacillus sp.]HZG57007.1 hypothetical protein [Paenibacillus sp.]